jgi:large subunit ribosomal protein L13
MRTFMAKATDVERKWYVVDAQDKALGRVATEVARLLRGKHKPIFTPHVDTGDFVIVLNAGKNPSDGNKAQSRSFTTAIPAIPGASRPFLTGNSSRKTPEGYGTGGQRHASPQQAGQGHV